VPPRYVYWTILIGGQPTAFRARDREELLPTLHQLQRKSSDVVMRYFARGRLWDNPEQAQWARSNVEREKRGRDWRPGGRHQDPRARFDARKKGGGEQRPRRDKPAAPPRDRPLGGKPSGAPRDRSSRERPPAKPPDRPWSGKAGKPTSHSPRGDRPWKDKPASGTARGGRPWSGPASGAPRSGRPWRDKPGGGGFRKPWQKDLRGTKGSEKRDARRPEVTHPPSTDDSPKRRDDTPDAPPSSEQIVTKPKPPERG
jgi:hypothetical protein